MCVCYCQRHVCCHYDDKIVYTIASKQLIFNEPMSSSDVFDYAMIVIPIEFPSHTIIIITVIILQYILLLVHGVAVCLLSITL